MSDKKARKPIEGSFINGMFYVEPHPYDKGYILAFEHDVLSVVLNSEEVEELAFLMVMIAEEMRNR